MDIFDIPPARDLMLLLGECGGKGIRLDLIGGSLRDPEVLTILDGDCLIEFGSRQHCFSGVDGQTLHLQDCFEWNTWQNPWRRPIADFLPELLVKLPVDLRPWVRLTKKGQVAVARLNQLNKTNITSLSDNPSKSDRSAKAVADNSERDDGAVSAAALNAVVTNGLAGLLQAAARLPSAVKTSQTIRERLAADQTLYEWSQQDWAEELQVSKKTVNKSEAWKEIMVWRNANKVSKETEK